MFATGIVFSKVLAIIPKYIGRGYGKLLWRHLVRICKELNVKELVRVTSPQAKELYTKIGAEYIESN